MEDELGVLKNADGFQWDQHNINKNWLKHQVKFTECEQIFFNENLFIIEDKKHSQSESRWYALGMSDYKRKLFVVLTVRRKKIRVISVRDMNKKERQKYEKIRKNTKI